MMNLEKTMKEPFKILQQFLKFFSVFNISIWYDNIIIQEQVPDDVVIMCVNCGKTVDF